MAILSIYNQGVEMMHVRYSSEAKIFFDDYLM